MQESKNILYGVLLLIMRIALQALAHTIGGSGVKDFFLGLLLGVPLQNDGRYLCGRKNMMNS